IPLQTPFANADKGPKQTELMYQRAAILPLKRQGTIVGTITVIDDVTERVLREQQLQQQVSLREALLEISRDILTLNLEDCLKRILRESSAFLGAQFIAILLKEGNLLRVVGALVNGQECPEWPQIQMPAVSSADELPAESHIAAWVALSGQTARLEDIASAATQQKLRSFCPQSRSVVGAPLRAENEILGAIVAESTRPRAFTETEERLLLGLALSAAIAIRNAKLYDQLTANERQIRTIVETVPSAIIAFDKTHSILEFNATAEEMFGYKREEAIGQNFFKLLVPEDSSFAFASDISRAFDGVYVRGIEAELKTNRGRRIVTLWNLNRCFNATKGDYCVIASGLDITARKQAEAERERLITELRQAMSEIKTLKGFIPICAGCKKIRDDKGFWVQVEAYISSRSEAQFSHGLCPDCMKKYYPDIEPGPEQELHQPFPQPSPPT
ncbi:MAG: PAS domain S-box protein, partial [Verrucomicrobiae bacterium]|nr:PAS domain S-box protein [Verrucomicrobiae bacterium]